MPYVSRSLFPFAAALYVLLVPFTILLVALTPPAKEGHSWLPLVTFVVVPGSLACIAALYPSFGLAIFGSLINGLNVALIGLRSQGQDYLASRTGDWSPDDKLIQFILHSGLIVFIIAPVVAKIAAEFRPVESGSGPSGWGP
ncbi:MAG: hypothetical protein NTV94_14720 [Planctomycetota bacterium]|nr:hypothetical protein [Planctomycetota bacterium]